MLNSRLSWTSTGNGCSAWICSVMLCSWICFFEVTIEVRKSGATPPGCSSKEGSSLKSNNQEHDNLDIFRMNLAKSIQKQNQADN